MSEFDQQRNLNVRRYVARSAGQVRSMPKPALDDIPPVTQAHALGNQAMQRLLQARAIQPKLKINQPGDKYEQEADRVANEVMRMPEPNVSASSQYVSVSAPSRIQRMCSECEEEELQRQPVEEEEEEELLQAKEIPGQTPEINSNIETNINAVRSGGQPLSDSVREYFEPRFGHDFSQVRIHTGRQAAESAKAINARAFTIGKHVVFGVDQYAPQSEKGKRLMAHELTHVLQQSADSRAHFRSRPITSAPLGVRRACGRRKIARELEAMTDKCSGLSGNVLGDTYHFRVACDVFQPATELERLKEDAGKIGPQDVVEAHGFASEEGPENLNDDLSCVRAWRAAEVLTGVGVYGSQIRLFKHGATAGPRRDRRSVVIRIITPSAPEPKPVRPAKEKGEKVIIWLNAFIPRNVPGVTKSVPTGAFKGHTMLDVPWPHECFLTDNRDFSSSKFAEARMRQGLVIDVDTLQVTSHIKYSDPTTEIDCDEGHIVCRRKLNPNITYRVLERTATTLMVEISGSGKNPCVRIGPYIDYDGKLLLDKSHGKTSIAFMGRVDEFPAFEMYAVSTARGKPEVIFKSMPPAGNTGWDLFGGPTLRRRGFIAFY